MPDRLRRPLLSFILLVAALASGGCASTHPRDPLETINRFTHAVNRGVDTVLIEPVASGYRALVPQIVRTGVSNFFSNLDDVIVMVNNLLQGKVDRALSDTGRIAVNSTIGLAGLIDVASTVGLEKHNEDFGQTLGYWGIGDGFYLVLPLFGPSSLRDSVGLAFDYGLVDPVGHLDHVRTRNQLYAGRFLDRRAKLLEATAVIDVGAIDHYAYTRDAYFQRRRGLVFDGNPPAERFEEENGTVPKRSSGGAGTTASQAPAAAAPTLPLATEKPAVRSPTGAGLAPTAPPSDQAVRVVKVWTSGRTH